MKKKVLLFPFLQLILLFAVLPLCTSCEDEETTIVYYNLDLDSFTTGDGNEPIAYAIRDYLREQGVIDTQFQLTIDKLNVTNEEYIQLDRQALEKVTWQVTNVDYPKVLSAAGITVTPGRPAITFYFYLNRVALNGGIIKSNEMVYTIHF